MASHFKTVGFIGLGTMGLPMAQNLVEKLPKETKLYAFDISQESLNSLSAVDITGRVIPCTSASEVVNGADVLLTIVPEGSHVRNVFLDEKGSVLAGNLENKILIDCSTIDIETSTLVASEIQRQNNTAVFYDAPVSGGSLGAKDGTLTFMVGSSVENPNWELIEYLLSMMGKSIVPCGGLGMGLVAKLSNNYCSALIALATAEAMNIGMRSGMDPRILAKVFGTSTAQSTVCDKWCPVPDIVPNAPSSNGYKGGFKVQLMKKDMHLALQAGKMVDAKMALGERGFEVYSGAAEDPHCRDLDSRVVFRYIDGNEEWKASFTE